MQHLVKLLSETWFVTQQMAPYLLFGFLMAGLLSVFVSPATIERHLGKPGLWQTVKAALLGVPLPLCSCSVVPVSASLYRHGASKGATLSFLASTPQTGVDSIAVTWSLLGPVFVLFRVISAFVSGILAGCGVELHPRANPETPPEPEQACPCCHGASTQGKLKRVFHYGFVSLPSDIGRAMLLGLLLSGLLTAAVPENFFADKIGTGFASMLVMMIVGIPIYTCSSGSVPVAFGLIRAGLTPGAALVFLVTGPATNAATIATIAKLLGRRAVIVYLLCISGTALAAGLLLNLVVTRTDLVEAAACAHPARQGWPQTVMAILLLAMLAPSLRGLMPSKGKKTSAASDETPPR